MSEGKKIRWGILGVAKINERLKPAFAASKTVSLVGIASRDLHKAQKAAQEFSIPKAYGSYEELIDDPDIEAVYIPLPNHLHDVWTRKAADAGKHILCEKPLCPTAPQASDLVEYCHKKGVRLMDGFMWPHHPRTHQIRQQIDSGMIGRVINVVSSFTFLLPDEISNIRYQPEMGGGALLDVGCYCVYGIRWAFGIEPVKAFAKGTFRHDVDVSLSAILTFADGRTACFDCGFNQPMRQWHEIIGETGVIRIPQFWVPNHQAEWFIEREDQEPQRFVVSQEEQMVHMLDDFARAIWEQTDATPNPQQAVLTLKVLDAVIESARTGKEVAIQ
jgi:predicted dehydrogenase